MSEGAAAVYFQEEEEKKKILGKPKLVHGEDGIFSRGKPKTAKT